MGMGAMYIFLEEAIMAGGAQVNKFENVSNVAKGRAMTQPQLKLLSFRSFAHGRQKA